MSVGDLDQLALMFRESRFHDLVAAARSADVTPRTEPHGSQLLAAALFRIGEFHKAGPLLDELEPAFGLNSDFLSLYAANCRRLGQLDRAEELFLRALQISPESLQVRNNSANLLIDLKRFEEARQILLKLLEESPDYADARNNLNRLTFQTQSATSPSTSGPFESATVDGWSLADPLLLAFSDDEIAHSKLRQPNKLDSPERSFVNDLPGVDSRAVALDQLKQAFRAVSDGQCRFALELCAQASRVLGSYAPIYDCASDAYLNLKKFQHAELCLLHALALDSPTPKRCLNLVSFASMRSDINLAKHYLDIASSLDPSHPQLNPIRNSLQKRFNNSKPSPFSLD